MNLEQLLEKLQKVKESPAGSGQYIALCPAHDDTDRSFSIKEGKKGLVFHCFVGCDHQVILDILRITDSELFYEEDPDFSPSTAKRLKEYRYEDEKGNLKYGVVRFARKKVRHIMPDGSWRGPPDEDKVLYNLRAVLENTDQTIWITEGEKDADVLIALGKIATTNSAGADAWHDHYAQWLACADIVIVEDRDEAGRKRTQKIIKSLRESNCTIRVVQAAVGNDITDHIGAGFGLDELIFVDPDAPLLPKTNLPDAFWKSRPELLHIKQAAHARLRSADAVFHAILTRVASMCPYTLHIPAISGSSSALCYYAICLANVGQGKSTSYDLAIELLPGVDWLLDSKPIGSGQGIAEAFMDSMPDPNNSKKTIRYQKWHNLNLFLDEGSGLGDLDGQKGSVLIETLRSAWTGQTLGQTNASADRNRKIDKGSYVLGLFVGIQIENSQAILQDRAGGLPQRFGWTLAVDKSYPEVRPDWPGCLPWAPPAVVNGPINAMNVDQGIWRVIEDKAISKLKGELEVKDLDGHEDLFRLKVAALLAVLNGRINVNAEDWALAGQVQVASVAVRDVAEEAVRVFTKLKTENTLSFHKQKEVITLETREEQERAREEALIARYAHKLALLVREQGSVTRAEFSRTIKTTFRHLTDDAIQFALLKNWIQVEQGARLDTKTLLPGIKRP